MTDFRQKVEEIIKSHAEQPEELNEIDVFTTYTAQALINAIVRLHEEEKKKRPCCGHKCCCRVVLGKRYKEATRDE